jgi:hypothetical protein
MLLPIVLILLAILAAAGFAMGTLPYWGAYHHGIEVILWSRRLEWPLLTTAVLLCLGLAAVVLLGKKRPVWLIGILPVLYLVAHRINHAPGAGFFPIQDPIFIRPAQASSLPASDLVIGVIAEGKPTAFPCTSLYKYPIIIRTGREKPMVLLWSPWANRALAFNCDRELRAGDLEIVCPVRDTFVIYNSRLGEFINAMTGQKFDGSTPTDFHGPIETVQTTWAQWQALHPDTVIAALKGADGDFSKPLLPKDPLPESDPTFADHRKVCIVACTQPIAVPSDAITDKPMNLDSGQTPVLLVRINGIVRAFSRELPGDLIPRFAPGSDPKHKNVIWIDSDTNSEWSDTGTVVQGPREMLGTSLRPLVVEDDLYWGLMKFWYPDLSLATDEQIKASTVVEKAPVEKPTQRRRRNRVSQ